MTPSPTQSQSNWRREQDEAGEAANGAELHLGWPVQGCWGGCGVPACLQPWADWSCAELPLI